MNDDVKRLFGIVKDYLEYYAGDSDYGFTAFRWDLSRAHTRLKNCTEEVKEKNRALKNILDAIKTRYNGEYEIDRQFICGVIMNYMMDPASFNFEKAIEGIQATS